jgi:hypothetical protein
MIPTKENRYFLLKNISVEYVSLTGCAKAAGPELLGRGGGMFTEVFASLIFLKKF